MTDTSEKAYQVLARKYRPETFADLVGQDAMVRTLKNAFEADRIAQAFVMTGIRGTGKTTTARIIAKGMNCIGPDGTGGATIAPCGICEPCKAIADGQHVDVIEMDAASHTGVGDIREIIASVAYRAASARYKVYIIDEVHMLSTSAFNALLKTLEEPPEHVKFIFATTEIRKVPVTVLSRCQRFDLRRIEPEDMIALLRKIAGLEGAKIADDALALITRAAEGSARDAQSLLDQAISHGAGSTGNTGSADDGATETTADQVRAMLGLADRGRVLDLFDMIMKGDAAAALDELSSQYADGADPMAVLRDLAEITHWISVISVTPEAVDDPTIAPDERSRGKVFAAELSISALARMWQMLLKALEEVAVAPNTMMAAEMAVIRLTHVADMPTPDKLLRQLKDTPPPPPSPGGGNTDAPAAGGGGTPRQGGSSSDRGNAAYNTGHKTNQSGALAANPAQAVTPESALARFASFEQVVELIRANRDIKLQVEVEKGVRLAAYAPGRIEFTPTDDAPTDLATRLAGRLQAWTGTRWGVTLVNDCQAPTIFERHNAAEMELHDQAQDHPLVQAAFLAFPGAKIANIRSFAAIQAKAAAQALPEIDDEWDPFEA